MPFFPFRAHGLAPRFESPEGGAPSLFTACPTTPDLGIDAPPQDVQLLVRATLRKSDAPADLLFKLASELKSCGQLRAATAVLAHATLVFARDSRDAGYGYTWGRAAADRANQRNATEPLPPWVQTMSSVYWNGVGQGIADGGALRRCLPNGQCVIDPDPLTK